MATFTGKVAAGTNCYSVTVDPDGKYAYVANSASNTVSQYTIGADGSLTAMTPATVATGFYPIFITIDPTGKYAYVVNTDSDSISQYTIGANGSLAAMTPATAPLAPIRGTGRTRGLRDGASCTSVVGLRQACMANGAA